jgi:hypothetical protein
VKYPRWGRVLPLLLLWSCIYPGRMVGQKEGGLAPPQKGRLCVEADCTNLTWAGDHYDGRKDGKPDIVARFWLKVWEAGHVEFSGKTAMAIAGGFPLEATFTGRIAPGGGSIADGVQEWSVGYSASGTGTYSLTWDKTPSNAVALGNVGQFQAPRHSKANPNIRLPPGASEAFASYPADVRAVLLPEHELLPEDAVRPCDDAKEDDKDNTGVYDPVLSLEIGRFALRRGEYLRGRCWINHSAVLNANPRAVVLLGVLYLMGWTFPKDAHQAFHYFDGGGFRQRDPWAIYFMEQAFETGNGATKNPAKAAEFESYLMTHDDGQTVLSMIGADDASVVWRAARMRAIANAPTKPTSKCDDQPRTNPSTGVRTYGTVCDTTYVTDYEALQRELDRLDQQYRDEINQNQ